MAVDMLGIVVGALIFFIGVIVGYGLSAPARKVEAKERTNSQKIM